MARMLSEENEQDKGKVCVRPPGCGGGKRAAAFAREQELEAWPAKDGAKDANHPMEETRANHIFLLPRLPPIVTLPQPSHWRRPLSAKILTRSR